MSSIPSLNFEVTKNNLASTRIIQESISLPLAEDQVLLKVDKFALTANNISYGVAGDLLGYWRFFPASDDDWGRLPTMGYGQVQASNCDEIKVGERVWGFFPMSSHLLVQAGKVHSGGFTDISEHRRGLSPVYSTFERVKSNPFYQTESEDYEMLVRGLYTTSWLVDDYMSDHHYFGAVQYLITSASSKTSIALAFAIKERGEKRCIGLTSESNKSFVESIGCYDQVITYNDIFLLTNTVKSILVDMAGSQSILSRVHHHFGDNLCYSARIGATHHDELFMGESLPGAEPIFFFAPDQIAKRTKEWGHREVMKRIGLSLCKYIVFCKQHIKIEHSISADKLTHNYLSVLAGKAVPSVGHIVSIGSKYE